MQRIISIIYIICLSLRFVMDFPSWRLEEKKTCCRSPYVFGKRKRHRRRVGTAVSQINLVLWNDISVGRIFTRNVTFRHCLTFGVWSLPDFSGFRSIFCCYCEMNRLDRFNTVVILITIKFIIHGQMVNAVSLYSIAMDAVAATEMWFSAFLSEFIIWYFLIVIITLFFAVRLSFIFSLLCSYCRWQLYNIC